MAGTRGPALAEHGDARALTRQMEKDTDTRKFPATLSLRDCRCVAGRGQEPRQAQYLPTPGPAGGILTPAPIPRALSGQSQGWASPRASLMPQGHRRRLGKLLRPLAGHFLRPRGDALALVSGPECRRRVGVGHPAHSAQPAPRAPRSRAPCAASAPLAAGPRYF